MSSSLFVFVTLVCIVVATLIAVSIRPDIV